MVDDGPVSHYTLLPDGSFFHGLKPSPSRFSSRARAECAKDTPPRTDQMRRLSWQACRQGGDTIVPLKRLQDGAAGKPSVSAPAKSKSGFFCHEQYNGVHILGANTPVATYNVSGQRIQTSPPRGTPAYRPRETYEVPSWPRTSIAHGYTGHRPGILDSQSSTGTWGLIMARSCEDRIQNLPNSRAQWTHHKGSPVPGTILRENEVASTHCPTDWYRRNHLVSRIKPVRPMSAV